VTKSITYDKLLNICDVQDKQKMGKVTKTFVIRQLMAPVGKAIHRVINRFCGKNNTQLNDVLEMYILLARTRLMNNLN
jgi:hypothetical protein